MHVLSGVSQWRNVGVHSFQIPRGVWLGLSGMQHDKRVLIHVENQANKGFPSCDSGSLTAVGSDANGKDVNQNVLTHLGF